MKNIKISLTLAEISALLKFTSCDQSSPQFKGLIITGNKLAATDGRRMLSLNRKAGGDELPFPFSIPEVYFLLFVKEQGKIIKKTKWTGEIVFEIEMEQVKDGSWWGKVESKGFYTEMGNLEFRRAPRIEQVMPAGKHGEKPIRSRATVNAEYLLEGAKALQLINGARKEEQGSICLPLYQYESLGAHGPCFYDDPAKGLLILIMPLHLLKDDELVDAEEAQSKGREIKLQEYKSLLLEIVALHDGGHEYKDKIADARKLLGIMEREAV